MQICVEITAISENLDIDISTNEIDIAYSLTMTNRWIFSY